jgi:hypothetical protein
LNICVLKLLFNKYLKPLMISPSKHIYWTKIPCSQYVKEKSNFFPKQILMSIYRRRKLLKSLLPKKRISDFKNWKILNIFGILTEMQRKSSWSLFKLQTIRYTSLTIKQRFKKSCYFRNWNRRKIQKRPCLKLINENASRIKQLVYFDKIVLNDTNGLTEMSLFLFDLICKNAAKKCHLNYSTQNFKANFLSQNNGSVVVCCGCVKKAFKLRT